MKQVFAVGLDVGSTTIKVAVLDAQKNLLYNRYRRHFSDVRQTLYLLLEELVDTYPEAELSLTVTGSGGIAAAHLLQLPFLPA